MFHRFLIFLSYPLREMSKLEGMQSSREWRESNMRNLRNLEPGATP